MKEEYRDQLLESVEISRKTANDKMVKAGIKSKEKLAWRPLRAF